MPVVCVCLLRRGVEVLRAVKSSQTGLLRRVRTNDNADLSGDAGNIYLCFDMARARDDVRVDGVDVVFGAGRSRALEAVSTTFARWAGRGRGRLACVMHS